MILMFLITSLKGVREAGGGEGAETTARNTVGVCRLDSHTGPGKDSNLVNSDGA